jgi:hypothetical protein
MRHDNLIIYRNLLSHGIGRARDNDIQTSSLHEGKRLGGL